MAAEPPITVRFPKQIADAIRDRANSENSNINAVIVEACRNYLGLPKQPTLEEKVNDQGQQITQLRYDVDQIKAIVLREE
jgi:hypothetical protein